MHCVLVYAWCIVYWFMHCVLCILMKTEYVVVVEQAPPLGPAYSIIPYIQLCVYVVHAVFIVYACIAHVILIVYGLYIARGHMYVQSLCLNSILMIYQWWYLPSGRDLTVNIHLRLFKQL